MAPFVTGSTSLLNQTTPALTWSFAHNLNTKYVNFEVYDSTDYTMIPSAIRVIDTNNAEIHMAYPTTGRAVANFSGINGQMNAQTSSLALTASFVLPLSQSVIITGSLSLTGSARITDNLSVIGTLTPGGMQNVRQFNTDTSFLGGSISIGKQSAAITGYVLDVTGSALISGSLVMSGSFTQNGFKILTAVSQSLNFANDASAAAGGVPLGGLYRSGNFILIRLS
jgi:hypothetical protein